jgi:hypothetical protein
MTGYSMGVRMPKNILYKTFYIVGACALISVQTACQTFEAKPEVYVQFAGLWSGIGPSGTAYNEYDIKPDGTGTITSIHLDGMKVFKAAVTYKANDEQVYFSIPEWHQTMAANYLISSDGKELTFLPHKMGAKSMVFIRGRNVEILARIEAAAGTAAQPAAPVQNVSAASPARVSGIEGALQRSSQELMNTLSRDMNIAIISVSSADADVAVFITGELEYILVQNKYSIVDRNQLDKIKQEQNFQTSGDVDDSSAVSIGKFAGAGIVITGSITGTGTTRRLRLRALDTQTAKVVGMTSVPY